MKNQVRISALSGSVAASVATSLLALGGLANAQDALPGAELDPTTVPKYVIPLVIPPVMNNSGTADDYDIAVRQFKQQILPGGHWNTLAPKCAATPGLCNLPATTVWSYGPAGDPLPDSTGIGGAAGLAPAPNSQFNYPAYTVEVEKSEATDSKAVSVDWINDLVVDPWPGGTDNRNFLTHLVPVDRTLHWANPEMLPCVDETTAATGNSSRATDCRPAPFANPLATLHAPYDGPVPVVVHVHGAHVGPESDGYPEAWWLPKDVAGADGYAKTGFMANKFGGTNTTNGVGSFMYPNDQPSTTLWYHDHSLGMTRNNVYAGPAGFWLIRAAGGGEDGVGAATVLPSPAPVAGEDLVETNVAGRHKYREIPIVIQDRSFYPDGSLFYPDNRAFFEGITPDQIDIPYYGEASPNGETSDIAPLWNPEAFFNVMVVNGVAWPELEVAPAIYRFRLLNGSNSRFINLSLQQLGKNGRVVSEVPFYQIGAEQSVLPQVVRIETGFATPLPGDGSNISAKHPTCVNKNGKPRDGCVVAAAAAFPEQANLIGPAERADVLVDFRDFGDGDIIRMINTGPDAPFGGFPDVPADPATTGQVMQFRVNATLMGEGATDPLLADGTPNPNAATAPWDVSLTLPEIDDPALQAAKPCPGAGCRDLALLEEESTRVCASVDPAGNVSYDGNAIPDGGECFDKDSGDLVAAMPFGPQAAVLGTNGASGPVAQLWSEQIEQMPTVGSTETWEMWNHSADAHPMHMHLVKFKVIDREAFTTLDDGTVVPSGAPVPAAAHEAGWKDTVIAYPGEVTRVNATFDLTGLYVWHCHIVEHEDNEMMVPYCVMGEDGTPGAGCVESGQMPAL